jgi:hypothetical protein
MSTDNNGKVGAEEQLSAGIEDSSAEPESGGREVTTMRLWTGLLFSLRDLLWRRT